MKKKKVTDKRIPLKLPYEWKVFENERGGVTNAVSIVWIVNAQREKLFFNAGNL